MACFSDSPFEVVEQVVDALQDDLPALEACSQTCLTLLPLCRKHLFRTIELTPHPWRSPKLPRLPRKIVLFGRLLDITPGIADYVRNLVYQPETPDFEDDDVPRILQRLRRVEFFQLIGLNIVWNTLHPRFRECLSNTIQSPSVTRLDISYIKNFPITTCIPCINLLELTLVELDGTIAENYEQENSASKVIPQLQSFSFDGAGRYANALLKARRPNGLPILDFSNIRTLTVNVEKPSDLLVTRALVKAAKRLENLDHITYDLIDGFMGLAEVINLSCLSTLRKLRFEFCIKDDIQDPLCGLCDELSALAGSNVIEEIKLRARVDTDNQCKTGVEWGRLDVVLTNGFPHLCRVSLRIDIPVFSQYYEGIALQEKLNKLPVEQFPTLSDSKEITFDFLTEVCVV